MLYTAWVTWIRQLAVYSAASRRMVGGARLIPCDIVHPYFSYNSQKNTGTVHKRSSMKPHLVRTKTPAGIYTGSDQ